MLDELFKRIEGELGEKFMAFYAGADPQAFRSEWSAALADMKPRELERGLVQMARQKFVPTLGEFAQWCRPAYDPEYAFHEAYHCLQQRDRGLKGDWSHPAVWRAAQSMAFEVRTGDYAKCRTRWKVALDKEWEHGWSDIPDPPLALAHDPAKVRPPNEAERRKIAELLGKGKEAGDAPETA